MQSVLQYRRFRTTVKAQLERDRERLRKEQPSTDESSSSNITGLKSPPLSSEKDESKQDLEKGVERGDFAAGQHPDGTRPPPNGQVDEYDKDVDAQAPGRSDDPEKDEAGHGQESEEEEVVDDDDGDDFELAALRTMSTVKPQQTAGTALGAVLSGVEVRKRTTREGGEGNVFVVCYEGPDDPNNPHNWSLLTRIKCTFMIASIGCVVGLASAIDSAALPQASKALGVSQVVESMATGLFLIGFGAGECLK